MKSILLTSTALVAFAGAAAADGHTSISFSGEAAAEFNTLTGYAIDTDLSVAMSATLDNGLTAAASIDVEANEGTSGEDTVTHGSVSLSSDTASITFGTGLDGAAFTAVGDDIAIGDGEEGVDGIVGTFSMGSADVTVSAPIAEGDTAMSADDIEVGITTDVNGWALGLGYADGDIVGTAAGNAGGLDITAGFGSAMNEWDLGVSYPIGAVTLSASTDEASAWTVGAEYDNGAGTTAGFEYNADETYELTAGFESGAMSVDGKYNGTDFGLDVAYDMGALVVGAGTTYTDGIYARADYDLGGGASAYVTHADTVDIDPAEDIAAGTTVGLSFTF